MVTAVQMLIRMNKVKLNWGRIISIFFCVLIVACVCYLSIKAEPFDIDLAARKTEKRLTKRMHLLDSYIDQALHIGKDELLNFDNFPNDLVIYKYINDSLQSWSNQFSETNDDISHRYYFSCISHNPNRLYSPLLKVSSEPSFINMGPKSYLVKSVSDKRGITLIGGIEILNDYPSILSSKHSGTNPKLSLNPKFRIDPLCEDSGVTVSLNHHPVFKITRNEKWNSSRDYTRGLFSPIVYADGPIFSSLGALLSINTSIAFILFLLFFFRKAILKKLIKTKNYRRNLLLYGCNIILIVCLVIFYIQYSLHSLSLNSDISLEIFRWAGTGHYSSLIYISYLSMLLLTWFQLYSLKPVLKEFFNFNFNALSTGWLIIFSLTAAAYLSIMSSLNGIEKENKKAWAWSDRLAIERDLSLELQLISAEEAIASDNIISTLVQNPNAEILVYNRIIDTHLSRIAQVRDIDIMLITGDDVEGINYLNSILAGSTQISFGSRFYYSDISDAQDSYYGIFSFANNNNQINRLIIHIPNNRDSYQYGYKSLMQYFESPGEINIPKFYSYAKYLDGRLISSRAGHHPYAYPTVCRHIDIERLKENSHLRFRANGYTHILTQVNENEIIAISRPSRKFTAYFTSFSFLFLSLLFVSLLFRKDYKFSKLFSSNIRSKINLLVSLSLILTLATVSLISVLFVYERNELNMKSLMTDRIGTLQALIERRVQYANSYEELRGSNYGNILNEIALTTKTDISLYTPSGKIFLTTNPDVYEKKLVGSLLNQDAYYNISRLNQRFFLQKEKFLDIDFYTLYAPIFNHSGNLIAIMSCPYTDKNYDFNRDVVLHSSLIFCVFFILLLVSIYISSVFSNNMLRHLTKLGQKMNKVDIHNLEEIEYKGNDEISSLVGAYNKMLRALKESSSQLAKAERDNAWSDMARQAAHEIKNSLTPMKLKIQKLIRLKNNNDESWIQQFEENSKVILEHIDILADTASGFSAIAKLSVEEAKLVNLDKILSEQVLIFDNKENIKITYIGLNDCYVNVPQSQMIRVFINLITNAIQAIEIRQKNSSEEGLIYVSLRNSNKDGYIDVAVEDNGTGVPEDCQAKLFTPNFTTKTSGTGLGLSICRSIIESCSGTIVYSKSFALGGACFKVSLPKCDNEQ